MADIVYIDNVRNKSIKILLQNSNGETQNLDSIVKQLHEHVHEQLSSKEQNPIVSKIYPLIFQTLSINLPLILDSDTTNLVMSMPLFKTTFSNLMIVSFLLLKYIQENKLKLVTEEKELSIEEIEQLAKNDSINTAISVADIMGLDPVEMLKKMLEKGEITQADYDRLVKKNSDE